MSVVFGECGQGKSTTLNHIVDLVKEQFPDHKGNGCNFKHGKSLRAVTSYVQQGTIGNMTLIDTPGLNDAEADRSDKRIFLEMINTSSMSTVGHKSS